MSEQRFIGRSTGSLMIGHECPEVVIVYSCRSEGGMGRRRTLGGIYQQRPWPIHVACLTNVSNGDIINLFTGIASSVLLKVLRQPLPSPNDYRPPNLLVCNIHPSPQVQILDTEYNPKVLQRFKYYGRKTLAEFPKSIELGNLRPGQDPNNKEHTTTIASAPASYGFDEQQAPSPNKMKSSKLRLTKRAPIREIARSCIGFQKCAPSSHALAHLSPGTISKVFKSWRGASFSKSSFSLVDLERGALTFFGSFPARMFASLD
ncbi:hypothetical protein G4B88_000659 [Cannabis sativa]|uniref:Uncharacterized protein n=1 Tax=Cannabis sativa TaxID=3483 RepID=A0A7J6HHH3_CANSA|nr:hypothetical protein G4B88_000659 [Cannabis sativa]